MSIYRFWKESNIFGRIYLFLDNLFFLFLMIREIIWY